MLLISPVTCVVLFSLVICYFTKNVTSAENDRCGPNGSGICKHICSCEHVTELLTKGGRPNLPVCGFVEEKFPLVCCPYHRLLNMTYEESQRFPVPFSRIMCNQHYDKICGKSRQATFDNCKSVLFGEEPPSFYPFAVGGQHAKSKELPFMGLVGYEVRNETQWACGCSLISDRFVLSAAHCTKHPSYGPVRIVRLGELDYSTKDEMAAPQDFKVERLINHPNYRSKFVYNDIALYKLERKVFFSDFIRPICLPTPASFRNVKTVFGAGWGRTDFVGPLSSALIKVNLDYLKLDQCSGTVNLNVMPQGLDRKSMICAGVIEGGRDTCSGDSGGPLFLPPPENGTPNTCFLYTQLGITSFGKNCAAKGLPGVYTNVLNYLPWIESVVWPIDDTSSDPIWKR